MEKRAAVIDTNVLYAGLYSATGASHKVLRLIEKGVVTPLLSTTLLFEYEEVLRRNQKRLRLSDRALNDVLDGLCARAECRRVHFLWRPQLSDAKDDHVLELAVAAGGADIVTHNVKDFVGAAAFGVRIITPAKLLGELK
ncbi:MAG: putative toxin-antitoxin system toxin component, PIN family [Planctomycetes bacterium]|nr:putative toxin-antitoxin system toxin component, PIN family [Planctomycetota bacterium]